MNVSARDHAKRSTGKPSGHVLRRRSSALAGLELVTGAAGPAGGLLLAIAPDGSLLHADQAVLAGTPFSNWRTPGVFLAGLVGGRFGFQPLEAVFAVVGAGVVGVAWRLGRAPDDRRPPT